MLFSKMALKQQVCCVGRRDEVKKKKSMCLDLVNCITLHSNEPNDLQHLEYAMFSSVFY